MTTNQPITEQALEPCPWCPTTRRETHETETGTVGIIFHREGCIFDGRQILTPGGVKVWNTRLSPASAAPARFIAAFKDAAIKTHIGFKHEGPWEKCEWIECEDRRKMFESVSAASVAPTVDARAIAETVADRWFRNALPERARVQSTTRAMLRVLIEDVITTASPRDQG